MIKVSIIIINYNTFKLTCNSIDSINRYTKGVKFEIIVIDNASSEIDPSEFTKLFPDIRLIMNSSNVGFSKAINQGIKLASGELILLLNSDTLLQNDAVSITAEFLISHSEYGAASSKLTYPNGNIQHCCQKFPSVMLKFLESSRLHKLMSPALRASLFQGAYFDHLSFSEPDWIWGTFFMFPKKILKLMKNSQLNEDYFMYIEDMQWCFDIRKEGYKIAYLPQAHILHFGGASSGNKNLLLRENFNKFIESNYSPLKRYFLKI